MIGGLFLLFLSIGWANAQSNTHSIRLVQYNVEWLFTNGSSCPGSGCSWNNLDEAMTHIDHVANVVSTLEPDILHMCEVQGIEQINILSETYTETNTNTNTKKLESYLVPGTDTSTEQNVGLLVNTLFLPEYYPKRNDYRVNWPIETSTCGYIGEGGTEGVSKNQFTIFNISNNLQFALIGAHLLAKPTDVERCAKREAQATVLRQTVDDFIKQGIEVILVGDMNDFDGTVLDQHNNTPISSVLEILKGGGDSTTLFSVAENIDKKERYTDWWDSDGKCDTTSDADYSMIDHILITKGLIDKIDNVFIYHNYSEFCGKLDSDHYPIVVDILI